VYLLGGVGVLREHVVLKLRKLVSMLG